MGFGAYPTPISSDRRRVFLIWLGLSLIQLMIPWDSWTVFIHLPLVFLYFLGIHHPSLLFLWDQAFLSLLQDGLYGFPLGSSGLHLMLSLPLLIFFRRLFLIPTSLTLGIGYGVYLMAHMGLDGLIQWGFYGSIVGHSLLHNGVISFLGYPVFRFLFSRLQEYLESSRLD